MDPDLEGTGTAGGRSINHFQEAHASYYEDILVRYAVHDITEATLVQVVVRASYTAPHTCDVTLAFYEATGELLPGPYTRDIDRARQRAFIRSLVRHLALEHSLIRMYHENRDIRPLSPEAPSPPL